MTALFVVIMVEQWEKTKQHISAVLGIAVTVICLMVFGVSDFLIPSMIGIIYGGGDTASAFFAFCGIFKRNIGTGSLSGKCAPPCNYGNAGRILPEKHQFYRTGTWASGNRISPAGNRIT